MGEARRRPRRPRGTRRSLWGGIVLAGSTATLWAVLALGGWSVRLEAADAIRIVPVVRDDHVLISFELATGFTDEVRAAIQSGLRTSFTYTVELRLEVPAWLDRTVASAVVTSSVHYDTLTRRYRLVRTIDGRVDAAEVTQDEGAVRRWLTTLERTPLFPTALLQPNREYYIRVSARLRPITAFLWPWTSGPSGQARFTFVR